MWVDYLCPVSLTTGLEVKVTLTLVGRTTCLSITTSQSGVHIFDYLLLTYMAAGVLHRSLELNPTMHKYPYQQITFKGKRLMP